MRWQTNWWHDTPATEKQIAKLRSLKVEHEADISIGEASFVIDTALRHKGDESPDPDTRVVLMRYGMTAREACARIAAYVRELRHRERTQAEQSGGDEERDECDQPAREIERAILKRYGLRFAETIRSDDAHERIEAHEGKLHDRLYDEEQLDWWIPQEVFELLRPVKKGGILLPWTHG